MNLLMENETPIVIQISVIKQFGETQAKLLSRLHYWLPRATKKREGKMWVYKTNELWAKELGMSVTTIKNAISDLENQGVLISRKFESGQWYQGKSYRIDYDLFYDIMGASKPVDKSIQGKIVQDIPFPSDNSCTIITDNTLTINTSSVCMDLGGVMENKEEFWNQEEDWSIIKTLGDCRVDPDSNEGITFATIAKELKVSADQLKEALNIMFNAKFYIKNPFGFVKKVLRDFVSGESAYFNYHYRN